MKFSTAAQIKFGSKEKGVSWSLQESEFGPPSPGNSTAFTPPNPTHVVPVRGAKYRGSSNLDKLMTQLDKQILLAAMASALTTSLHAGVELGQASEGKIPPHQDPTVLISGAREVQPPPGIAGSVQGNAPVRSSLFGDLTTLCHEATVCASSVDLVVGLSLITTMGAMASDHVSALAATNYPSIQHTQLPENKVEDAVLEWSMFSLSHRTSPGSIGHFWFLQVGIWYLEDQDSKTTMLLGLSSLADILPDAIDGFALHPLDTSSSLPALTNKRVEDGFPGSAVLAFQYFLVKDKRNRLAGQQMVAPPSQPSPYRHNNKEDYSSRRLCGA